MKRVLFLVAMSGCSSLVSDPCMNGFHLEGNDCMPNVQIAQTDGGVDGPVYTVPPMHQPGSVDVPDAPTAPVCSLPETACGDACVTLDSDPSNCGHCGRTCESGICSAGACVGDVSGHVIVIGHDYVQTDPAMNRVIANSITAGGLASASNARVGWYKGSATNEAGIPAATSGLASVNLTMSTVTVTSFDVIQDLDLDAIVIEPQSDGDAAEAAGTAAAAKIQQFLVAGHAVIALEKVAGSSYRFMKGAGLVVLPAPVDASSQQVTVVAPGDSLATGVVSPYLAKPGSVGFTGAAHAVVTDGTGDVVVIHAAY
ncbi:MAG: hypothetical protein QM831_13820 [Kofleriaceae bacterium]